MTQSIVQLLSDDDQLLQLYILQATPHKLKALKPRAMTK